MDNNSSASKNSSLKIFLILSIIAVVLVVGVTLAVYFITREPDAPQKEYPGIDYGEDPSGGDEDFTNRY